MNVPRRVYRAVWRIVDEVHDLEEEEYGDVLEYLHAYAETHVQFCSFFGGFMFLSLTIESVTDNVLLDEVLTAVEAVTLALFVLTLFLASMVSNNTQTTWKGVRTRTYRSRGDSSGEKPDQVPEQEEMEEGSNSIRGESRITAHWRQRVGRVEADRPTLFPVFITISGAILMSFLVPLATLGVYMSAVLLILARLGWGWVTILSIVVFSMGLLVQVTYGGMRMSVEIFTFFRYKRRSRH